MSQTESGGELPIERPWKVYVASAVGAMVVSVADAVSSADSTVTRLTGALPLPLRTEYTALLMVFLVIPLAGFALSWVNRPRTRTDGFARGLAVFALLGLPADRAAAPDATDPDVTVSQIERATPAPAGFDLANLFWIREARAQDPDRYQAADSEKQLVRLVLIFEEAGRAGTSERAPRSTVMVRDVGTGKLLTRRSVAGDFKLEAPVGRYSILVEADGYRRTGASLAIGEVEAEPKAYELRLKKSMIPIAVQRLYPVAEAGLVQPR